jgi:hypothetical protein
MLSRSRKFSFYKNIQPLWLLSDSTSRNSRTYIRYHILYIALNIEYNAPIFNKYYHIFIGRDF